MIIKSLSELLHAESDSFWIVDKLLAKRQSILLSGRVENTSLLALQLALDVAGGKLFLGEYQAALGKVLFIDKNKTRIKEHARLLARRLASTDNVQTMILDAGDEAEIVRTMKIENPALTILGAFPGSLDLLHFLVRVGPVIAITSGEHIGPLPLSDIWSLQGDRLIVKPMGLAIHLSRSDSGFVFESEEEYVPNSIYVAPKTDRVQWRNASAHSGIGIKGQYNAG